MSPFTGFSEAAKLYAERYDVVAAMAREFESNLNDFLQAVRHRTGELIETAIEEKNRTNSPYRYWWLEGHPRLAQVWFRAVAPEALTVFREQRLTAYVGNDGLTEAYVAAIRDLATTPELTRFCQPRTHASGWQSTWNLLDLELRVDPKEPVESVAEATAAMFRAIKALPGPA